MASTSFTTCLNLPAVYKTQSILQLALGNYLKGPELHHKTSENCFIQKLPKKTCGCHARPRNQGTIATEPNLLELFSKCKESFESEMSSSSKNHRNSYFKLFLLICLVQGILLLVFAWWRLCEDNVNVAAQSLEPRQVSQPSTTTVNLFVAILTHSKRRERRDAIRETWLSLCKKNPQQISCRFFTDDVGLDDGARKALQHEREQNNDMVLLNATDNFAFAERLLLIWEWTKTQNINYDYFLRIDDDHFLCVERVIQELQHRPKNGLYWGFIHCKPRIVRVDEAWLLLSQDLVQEIMAKRDEQSLLCSPYGDQAVAMWINLSEQNVTYFMDNQRIVHKSAGRNPTFLHTNICTKYLSLHGTYPRAMRQFWVLSQILRKKRHESTQYEIPEIANFSKLCAFSPRFEYTAFLPEYQFEPKLCHLKPKWSISKNRHSGREEDGERYSSY